MKKLFLLAAATFGMLLSTSCNKDDDKSSSEKTIKSAVISGYVSMGSGVLKYGTAELKMNSTSLKTLSATDTAFSFNVTTFPAKDTLTIVLKRNTTAVDTTEKCTLGYSYRYTVKNVYSDETTGLVTSDGLDVHVRLKKADSTKVAKYFEKSPITIATFKFDEKGNFIPAN